MCYLEDMCRKRHEMNFQWLSSIARQAFKSGQSFVESVFYIRLIIFLTLARACDKRLLADHNTMLRLLIKAFGPWAFRYILPSCFFLRIFRREVAKIFSHSFFRLLILRISE